LVQLTKLSSKSDGVSIFQQAVTLLMMQVVVPLEIFPEPGTVANPAALYDGDNVFVCYEASARDGGGNVVLRFGDVIDFRVTPVNVDGLGDCRYPIKPWAFNEILGGAETSRWTALAPRFWMMSFNDVTIEILFDTVAIASRDSEGGPQHKTLMNALAG
jgi:hypothetical protein